MSHANGGYSPKFEKRKVEEYRAGRAQRLAEIDPATFFGHLLAEHDFSVSVHGDLDSDHLERWVDWHIDRHEHRHEFMKRPT